MATLASLYERLFSSTTVQIANGALLVQSAPARYLAWIAAFVVLVPLSWWCWRRNIGGRFAAGMFFASFTIPLIIVPGIAAESITASAAAIEIRTGFWFSPTRVRVSLADVEFIEEQERMMRQRGAPRQDTYWIIRYQGGGRRSLHLSDMFVAARHHIRAHLQGLGIDFKPSP